MNQVIMFIMACGAILGGVDYIMGNRLGYGKKFEEGFQFLGPMAMSMVGIICLSPLISEVLGPAVIPFFHFLGVDPAMFGALLAIDMGGYQLAMELAENPIMGQYAGIVVSAIFGCTIVFTIPVGMGMVEEEDRPVFAQGIMLGLSAMPAALIAGGLACGLGIGDVIHQNLPVLMLSVVLAAGLFFAPEKMVKGFEAFAFLIKIIVTTGLVLAAVTSMTGLVILPGMTPVSEAMAVVSSIGVVLLGSLPATEALQRVLKRPCTALGEKIGLDSLGVLGLLVSMVSAIPVLAMLKDMNYRGKLVNVAYMVSSTSMLAAHLGFTVSTEPDMLTALFLSKITGSVTAVIIGLLVSKKEKTALS